MFHPVLKECVEPTETWNCRGETTTGNWREPEDNFDLDLGDEIIESVYNSGGAVLNALEQDSVPLSVVNNPQTASIEKQMFHLKRLINALRASTPLPVTKQASYQNQEAQKPQRKETPLPHSPHISKHKLPHAFNEQNVLPDQLNKITAQLMFQTPPPNLQQTNLNFQSLNALKYTKQNRTNYAVTDNPETGIHNEQLVTSLFQKYLSNVTFSNSGQFFKYPPSTTETSRYSIKLISGEQDEATQKIRAPNSDSVLYLNSRDPSHFKKPFDDPNHPISVALKNQPSYKPSVAYRPSINQIKRPLLSCVPGTRLPNPTNCTKYYICGASNNAVYDFACPPNSAFNTHKRICDVKEYKNCSDVNWEPTEQEQEIDEEETVTDDFDCNTLTRFPDPYSLKHYRICVFETPNMWKIEQRKCPQNTTFCKQNFTCLPKILCPLTK